MQPGREWTELAYDVTDSSKKHCFSLGTKAVGYHCSSTDTQSTYLPQPATDPQCTD